MRTLSEKETVGLGQKLRLQASGLTGQEEVHSQGQS